MRHVVLSKLKLLLIFVSVARSCLTNTKLWFGNLVCFVHFDCLI